MKRIQEPLLIFLLVISKLCSADEPALDDINKACSYVVENVSNEEWVRKNYYIDESTIIDINNDGESERLLNSYDGTMRIQHAYYKDKDGREVHLEKAVDINDEEFGDSASIIRFNGINYILYCKDLCKVPKYLEYISSSNTFHRVCNFKQKIVEENNSKEEVCKLLSSPHENMFINFNGETSLENKSEPGWSTSYLGTGLVDIKRNGEKSLLVSASLSGSGGSGCGYNYFSLVSNDGASVIQNGLSGIIPKEWNEELPFCNGNASGWLEVNGKLYFENKYPGEKPEANSMFHKVFEISSDGAHEVCNFNMVNKIERVDNE